MAFWGPFCRGGEHAVHACRTAVAQIQKLSELRAALPEISATSPGSAKLNIRIGLTTGEVTEGSSGQTRKELHRGGRPGEPGLATGIGEQDLWDQHPHRGVDLARGTRASRPANSTRFRGRKTESVRIFEVLGLKARWTEVCFPCAIVRGRPGGFSRREPQPGEARLCGPAWACGGPTSRPCCSWTASPGRSAGLPSDWDGISTLKEK